MFFVNHPKHCNNYDYRVYLQDGLKLSLDIIWMDVIAVSKKIDAFLHKMNKKINMILSRG